MLLCTDGTPIAVGRIALALVMTNCNGPEKPPLKPAPHSEPQPIPYPKFGYPAGPTLVRNVTPDGVLGLSIVILPAVKVVLLAVNPVRVSDGRLNANMMWLLLP